MDLHRLNLLDDHILVLRDLSNMISVEIEKAEDERRILLESLGMTEREDGEPQDSSESFSWTKPTDMELASEEFSGLCAERSVTPTSTLCCLHIEGSEVIEDSYGERRANGGTDIDDAGHASKMPFSEDLPTPRMVTCLDHAVAEEGNADPDMNNALADSDDDETSTDPHEGSNNSVSALAGDDGKMSRPRSSLNNGENDSDSEEEDGTKPQCWISNSVYMSSVVEMVKGKESSEFLRNEDAGATPATTATSPSSTKTGHNNLDCFPPPNTNTHDTATISLRSYDTILMEKAASAVRMANDIKRMKVELLDREAHIEFLYERHQKYKEVSKKEIQRRERDTRELRSQMDAATSSKFITFCKLQSAEARIAELEKLLRSTREEKQDVSTSDSSDDEAAVPTDGIVNLDISLRDRGRSDEQQFLRACSYKGIESNEHHPLQDTLRDTYERLLKAEKRGDELQHRVQQLQRKTAAKKKSTTITDSQNSSNSTPSKKATRKNKRTASLDTTTKSTSTVSHARIKSVQKTTGLASSNALRPKHDRSSQRCVSEANPASRLSKPIR